MGNERKGYCLVCEIASPQKVESSSLERIKDRVVLFEANVPSILSLLQSFIEHKLSTCSPQINLFSQAVIWSWRKNRHGSGSRG